MIEWPNKLLELYPLPPGSLRHPNRPWWSRTGNVWTRHDGAWVTRPYVLEEEGVTEEAALLPRLAAKDQELPLPPPGFRVGQVWATKEGTATQITRTPDIDLVVAAFLVHDAVCPWLAPWAPGVR